MFVYFSLAFIVPVLAFFFRNNEHKNRIVLAIVCSAMFLVLCLRNPFGFLDLPHYYNYFGQIKGFSFMEMLKGTRIIRVHKLIGEESGYLWLNWIISHLGMNFTVLLCLQAAFVSYSIFRFIDKQSLDPLFSIFFYMCIGGFSDHTYIIRQSIAFAILLFAFQTVVDRKPFRFLLLVLAATLFHRTALSFLLIYPLSYVKVTRKTAIAGIVISIASMFLVKILYSTVLLKIMQFLGKSGYALAEADFKEMLIVILAMLIFAILIAKKDLDLKDSILFWLTVMSLLFMSTSVYIYILSRVGMSMYLPFAAVLVPNLMKQNENEKVMGYFRIAIYVALSAYLAFIVITTPYTFSFIWENVPLAL